jgi:hypothetical protein
MIIECDFLVPKTKNYICTGYIHVIFIINILRGYDYKRRLKTNLLFDAKSFAATTLQCYLRRILMRKRWKYFLTL